MKRSLIAGVVSGLGLLAVAAMPASAADLPRGMPYKSPVVVSQYNWTGFYLGINGGAPGATPTGTASPSATARRAA